MRLRLPSNLVLALAALAAGCPPSAPERPARAPAEGVWVPRARLRQTSGEVMVKHAAIDEWLPAAASLELRENDKVRTAAGASAQIDFANGSLATIGEEALLAIGETRSGAEPTDLTLLKGKVAAELGDAASQSLSVSTPSATIRAGREIVFR